MSTEGEKIEKWGMVTDGIGGDRDVLPKSEGGKERL
jgi:hypothetical protein